MKSIISTEPGWDISSYFSMWILTAKFLEISSCAFSLGIVAISSGLNEPYFSESAPVNSSTSFKNLIETGFILLFLEIDYYLSSKNDLIT